MSIVYKILTDFKIFRSVLAYSRRFIVLLYYQIIVSIVIITNNQNNTRKAIITGISYVFVYNFHYKQQNCMKFQLEVYQDNAASHAANISHIRVTVLTKTVRDEFNSVTYVVRNTTHLIRNAEIVIKTTFNINE